MQHYTSERRNTEINTARALYHIFGNARTYTDQTPMSILLQKVWDEIFSRPLLIGIVPPAANVAHPAGKSVKTSHDVKKHRNM